MKIPEVILPKVKEAFNDMHLNYDKVNFQFMKVGDATIHILHEGQYVCSYNKEPKYNHRFDYGMKHLHLDYYTTNNKYLI
ncbi:hypothetical protein [Flavobacterium sp. ASW18X]|uniref:hypothetical protein n=1 Tax=Flavobacterium sp. ASW18X TaxID=2572595 RepID=UPI0010AE103C|nr:hypothetical protein [Flavobacterium sp. ASW18X]TKD67326.1 hypothetical protein FBT53_00545 [Flavobacterium sp. ASW18X]